jgi:hypothetical protein
MNNPLNDGGGPSSNTGSSLGANPNVRGLAMSSVMILNTMQGIGGFDGEVNPWGAVVPQNSDQTGSAPQNQEMDLDVDEEEQVSQLLNAPAFRIVIPGTEDLRQLECRRLSRFTPSLSKAPKTPGAFSPNVPPKALALTGTRPLIRMVGYFKPSGGKYEPRYRNRCSHSCKTLSQQRSRTLSAKP